MAAVDAEDDGGSESAGDDSSAATVTTLPSEDDEDMLEDGRSDGDWGSCLQCGEWTELHVTSCCSDLMCMNCMAPGRRCPGVVVSVATVAVQPEPGVASDDSVVSVASSIELL
eukprot:gene928-biopygen9454